jgi:hypothetical protein
MRIFLTILAMPAGALAALMAIATFTKDGSDIQMIGAGVFLTVMVVCIAGAGIMARIEKLGRKES